MRNGWYLWDWWNTGTIKFDTDIEFHCKEYAKTQSAFKTYKDCRRHGLAELKWEIEELQQRYNALKAATKYQGDWL